MTPWEILLWAQLKRKPLGYKFRHQHSIGRYIVDFYCAKKKFVIKLDGGQHFAQKEYNKEKTIYLNTFKIQVLRIWNDEIIKNMDGVMVRIEEYLKKDEEPSLSFDSAQDISP